MAGAPIGNKNGITHGMSKSRTYTTWRKMKARCLNKNANGYEDYGGIGIKVCNRWINSFEDFLSDMGERPEKHSIDRIDGRKGYFKKNCRWATQSEQNLNKFPYSNSGYKGVYKINKKFRASTKYNGKLLYIGTFDSPYLARLAFESCRYVLETSTR